MDICNIWTYYIYGMNPYSNWLILLRIFFKDFSFDALYTIIEIHLDSKEKYIIIYSENIFETINYDLNKW